MAHPKAIFGARSLARCHRPRTLRPEINPYPDFEMNILVLLSGIADPKWAMPATVDTAALDDLRTRYPLLSPFDEAALELALKVRDTDPTTHIQALLSASAATDPLLRHVAGFRLDQVSGFDGRQWPAWNGPVLARALAEHIRSLPTAPDLVLIGREFGDLDEGSLPALLADALALPYVSLVLGLRPSAQGLELVRQQGAAQESLAQPLPAVAAVTNHARNRLRHPLLKNVMAAKKMTFTLTELPAPGAAQVRLTRMAAAVQPVRTSACRMLEGDVTAQAQALAQLLKNPGVTA